MKKTEKNWKKLPIAKFSQKKLSKNLHNSKLLFTFAKHLKIMRNSMKGKIARLRAAFFDNRLVEGNGVSSEKEAWG